MRNILKNFFQVIGAYNSNFHYTTFPYYSKSWDVYSPRNGILTVVLWRTTSRKVVVYWKEIVIYQWPRENGRGKTYLWNELFIIVMAGSLWPRSCWRTIYPNGDYHINRGCENWRKTFPNQITPTLLDWSISFGSYINSWLLVFYPFMNQFFPYNTYNSRRYDDSFTSSST